VAVPERFIERLEEAVRLCDAAIARLEHDPTPGGSVLLKEMNAIRTDQIKHRNRLRKAMSSRPHRDATIRADVPRPAPPG
jgi:hypothetical protein